MCMLVMTRYTGVLRQIHTCLSIVEVQMDMGYSFVFNISITPTYWSLYVSLPNL
jgi:hypothetical protein